MTTIGIIGIAYKDPRISLVVSLKYILDTKVGIEVIWKPLSTTPFARLGGGLL